MENACETSEGLVLLFSGGENPSNRVNPWPYAAPSGDEEVSARQKSDYSLQGRSLVEGGATKSRLEQPTPTCR